MFKVALLALITFILLVPTLSAVSSLFLKGSIKNYNLYDCSGHYRGVPLCYFNDTSSGAPAGFYFASSIYVNRELKWFDSFDSVVKHEYCHYVQVDVEKRDIRFWEEFECYVKEYI